MANWTGLIEVTVVGIQGFKESEGNLFSKADKTDPYVMIEIGSQKFKTAVSNNGGNLSLSYIQRQLLFNN